MFLREPRVEVSLTLSPEDRGRSSFLEIVFKNRQSRVSYTSVRTLQSLTLCNTKKPHRNFECFPVSNSRFENSRLKRLIEVLLSYSKRDLDITCMSSNVFIRHLHSSNITSYLEDTGQMSTKDNINNILERTKSDILGLENNNSECVHDLHAS
jgi:hypothetical protein